MRIENNGANVINNEQNLTSSAQQSPVQNQSLEGSARNAANTSPRNVSGQLRAAEDGISAGLRANLIRSSSSPTLANFTDNLGSSMQTARPAAGTNTNVDRLVSSGTATPNSAIPDNGTVSSSINIADDLSVTGVKVNVDIAHTYRGDLVVKLRSPEGKEVVLKNREGGSADNLVFEANPADFNGANSKGNWTLVVEDKASADTGTLKSWSVAVTGNPKTPPPTPGVITKTATPNAAINDNSTVTSTINVTEEGQLKSLKLSADIAHTYRGDLVVKVKSPSGKEVILSNKAGGSADNLVLNDLDLSSQFAGEPVKGNWTFTVQDTASQDTGTFKSWGLKMETGSVTPNPNPTPTGPTKLQVQGDAAFRARVAADFAKFAPGTTVDAQGYVQKATTRQPGHDQGYALIDSVLASPNLVTVGFVAGNAYTQSGAGATTPIQNGQPGNPPGVGSQAQVFYDPALNISLPTLQPDGTIRDEGIASEVILAHELIHAVHAQRGQIDRTQVTRTFNDGNQRYSETWRYEEFRTTGFQGFRIGNEATENSIRAELGYKPRATYLDRSSWTAVNGVSANNGIAAGGANENSYRAQLPPVKLEPGQFLVCNCFGCGKAGVQPNTGV